MVPATPTATGHKGRGIIPPKGYQRRQDTDLTYVVLIVVHSFLSAKHSAKHNNEVDVKYTAIWCKKSGYVVAANQLETIEKNDNVSFANSALQFFILIIISLKIIIIVKTAQYRSNWENVKDYIISYLFTIRRFSNCGIPERTLQKVACSLKAVPCS